MLLLVSLLGGCGGSSGGGGGSVIKPGPINGVWAGSATRATDSLEIAWDLDGTTLTGMARLVRDGQTYIGEAHGAVDGNEIHFSADLPGLGRLDFDGTFTQERITGTYSLNEDTGTISLERRGDNTYSSVTGQYTGTWQSQMFTAHGNLEVNFEEQNANFVTGAFSVTGSEVGESGTFNAGVIGNKMTAGLAVVGTEDIQIVWNATVGEHEISGPYSVIQLSTGQLLDFGTFTVTNNGGE